MTKSLKEKVLQELVDVTCIKNYKKILKKETFIEKKPKNYYDSKLNSAIATF